MAKDISDRAMAVAPSATVAITERAKALRAEGKHVISFGAGEPDFPTPAHIVEAAAAAVQDPANHRYSATAGLVELREAIAAKTERDSGFGVKANQVVVTNGGKQAVYEALQALLDPGDEVLVPAPYWVTYPEAVGLAGGVSVAIHAAEDSGFRVSVQQLEDARSDKTKLLIFTSPSNPTGAVYPPGEVEAIGSWAADNGIWVLTDEMYEHLVYPGAEFSSMPGLVPAIRSRCIVVNAVSKSYAMTGWRVGWLIAPAQFAEAVVRIQTHLSTNVGNISQCSAIAALRGSFAPVEAMRDAFDRRRRTMFEMLNQTEGIHCEEPMGAFYAFPSVAGILGRRTSVGEAQSSLELAELLLEHERVAVVPGEAFGAPGYFRLSFALSDDDLVEGMKRMQRAFS